MLGPLCFCIHVFVQLVWITQGKGRKCGLLIKKGELWQHNMENLLTIANLKDCSVRREV